MILAMVAIGVLALAWLGRRMAQGRDRLARLTASAVVAGAGVLVAMIVSTCLSAPFSPWDCVRIAPAMAWLRGYPLYAGQASGAVLSTMYGPVATLAFVPAALVGDAAGAAIVGRGLACVFTFVPLLLCCRSARVSSGRMWRVSVLIVACFAMVLSPSLRYSATFLHADAPALGLMAVACLLAVRPGGPGFWAAMACGLAVLTKQTMIALPLVLLIAAWLTSQRTGFPVGRASLPAYKDAVWRAATPSPPWPRSLERIFHDPRRRHPCPKALRGNVFRPEGAAVNSQGHQPLEHFGARVSRSMGQTRGWRPWLLAAAPTGRNTFPLGMAFRGAMFRLRVGRSKSDPALQIKRTQSVEDGIPTRSVGTREKESVGTRERQSEDSMGRENERAVAVLRFLAILTVALLSLAILFLRFLDWDSLVLNVVKIPGGVPWRGRTPFNLVETTIELAIHGVPCLLALILMFRCPIEDEDPTVTRRTRIFAIAALAMVPMAVLGRVKQAGDVNSFSPALYPLLLALASRAAAVTPSLTVRRATVGLIAILTAFGGSRLAEDVRLLAKERPYDTEAVFLQAHPGEVYFPWNPAVHVAVEGRPTHHLFSAWERGVAGFPVSERHLRSALPRGCRYVAFPLKRLGPTVGFGSCVQMLERYNLLAKPASPVRLADLPDYECYPLTR